jgi:hypothetical protein
MSRTITNEDIAEIYDALGDAGRAELLRHVDRPDPDALTAEELADEIWAAVDGVVDSPSGAKHDSDCWRKHSPCLAEKIRELLP